ncbi:MAG TPA: isocitrate lyase/phosphoenolpyruvate mutase family protein [Terriglobales bacterium]|nr:isocitrate lyase/phosphoenolpyruvate mutase family protein [Terriglobales bacterium]
MTKADLQPLARKAEALRRLHHGPHAVVFPNAWDVTSARIVEAAGFPAIATTSAGIANLFGYPDSQIISRDEMLSMVARIAAAVSVPVSADMEAGYADTALQMYDTAEEIIRAGAVGLNLEDSLNDESRLVDLDLELEKIKAVRQASEDTGVPLVLNARTDAYWWKGAQPATRMKETIRRANAFREAGADCIFIPGLKDLDEIRLFLRESPGPLNILAFPGVPSIAELEEAGVRRVSIGSGGYRTAMGLMRRLVEQIKTGGSYDLISEYAIPFPEVNALLRK